MNLKPLLPLFLLAMLSTCSLDKGESPEPAVYDDEKMLLTKIAFSDIKGWESDNHAEAFGAFLKSCTAFLAQADSEITGKDQLLAPLNIWKETCRKANLVPASDSASARKFFEEEFIPYSMISNHRSHALITGYYEPLLNGSRTPTPPFIYPVYKYPAGGSNDTREMIDRGILTGKAEVIIWVDDPVKLFFMHIQGSGAIQVTPNDVVHVGYAGTNNHPYVAIGKLLVEQEKMKKGEVTMQSIRQWLYDHPQEIWQTLWQNPAYIFFQPINGGPYGSQRVALTAGRSLAVDRNYIPLGMPVFIDTIIPASGDGAYTVTRKLVIAQDTGSAIKGPLRGDLFFGNGYAAEQMAGKMKSGGDFKLLLPRVLASKQPDGFFDRIMNMSIWNVIPPEYNILPSGAESQ